MQKINIIAKTRETDMLVFTTVFTPRYPRVLVEMEVLGNFGCKCILEPIHCYYAVLYISLAVDFYNERLTSQLRKDR